MHERIDPRRIGTALLSVAAASVLFLAVNSTRDEWFSKTVFGMELPLAPWLARAVGEPAWVLVVAVACIAFAIIASLLPHQFVRWLRACRVALLVTSLLLATRIVFAIVAARKYGHPILWRESLPFMLVPIAGLSLAWCLWLLARRTGWSPLLAATYWWLVLYATSFMDFGFVQIGI